MKRGMKAEVPRTLNSTCDCRIFLLPFQSYGILQQSETELPSTGRYISLIVSDCKF